jgi:hypothetical protein
VGGVEVAEAVDLEGGEEAVVHEAEGGVESTMSMLVHWTARKWTPLEPSIMRGRGNSGSGQTAPSSTT